uniref:PWWP domain-containing protein n=1 Tax=Panagrellus redivivus TaxID=6233 RepID=A0A7E4V993_PANRE
MAVEQYSFMPTRIQFEARDNLAFACDANIDNGHWQTAFTSIAREDRLHRQGIFRLHHPKATTETPFQPADWPHRMMGHCYRGRQDWDKQTAPPTTPYAIVCPSGPSGFALFLIHSSPVPPLKTILASVAAEPKIAVTATVAESTTSPTAPVPAEVVPAEDTPVATSSAVPEETSSTPPVATSSAEPATSSADVAITSETPVNAEDVEIDVVDDHDPAQSTEEDPPASSTATSSTPVIPNKPLTAVNFDYGGPPITITNANPDNDMEPPPNARIVPATSDAATNPEAIVVSAPPSLASTVPNSVPTSNTNAILNVETMLNVDTVLSEDEEPCSSTSIPRTHNGLLPPGYSKTDSVIEDILRKAASEFEAASASSTSAPAPAPKPKRSRKKNGNAAAAAVATSVSGPIHITLPFSATYELEQSARINASVESVMQKVIHNVAFEEDFNPMIPAPNQQIIWPTAPPPSTGPQQTFYMVQDDHIYPLAPPPQAVSVPATQHIQQQQPPQQIQVQATIPAPPPAKKPRMTKKMKAAQAAAAAQGNNDVNGYLSPVPQNSIPASVYNPNQSGNVYRGAPSSGPQQVVIMQPGQNQSRQPTYQQVPVSYTPGPGSNGVPQYVYTNNINEYLRQGSNIVTPSGHVTKVVTLQPGMQIPPGAFVAQPDQSPAPTYTQVVPAQHSPPQPTQYIIQQQPPAPAHAPIPTPVAVQQVPAPVAAPPPAPAPARRAPAAAPAAVDPAEVPGPSSATAPKRRRKAVKKDNALANFDDSDFEDLDPSQKTLTKATKAAKSPKKTKSESPKKEATKKEPAAKKAAVVVKDQKGKKGTDKKVDDIAVRLKELAAQRNAGNHDPTDLIEEILLLQKVYGQEKTRGYGTKRRFEKLEEDYNRLFNRMQQTELSLAVHMSSCEKLKRDVKDLQEENRDLRIAQGVPQRVPTPEISTSSRALRASRRLGLPVAPPSELPQKPREHTPPPRVPSPTPEAAKKAKASSAAVESTPAPAPAKATKTRRGAAAASTSTAATTSNPPVTRRKRGRARSQSPVEEASPDSGVDAPVAESEPDQQSKSYTASDFLPRRAAASKRIRYF